MDPVPPQTQIDCYGRHKAESQKVEGEYLEKNEANHPRNANPAPPKNLRPPSCVGFFRFLGGCGGRKLDGGTKMCSRSSASTLRGRKLDGGSENVFAFLG